jgi:hypothetical protein
MKRVVFAIALLAACSPAPQSNQSKTETPAARAAPAPPAAPNAAALSAAPAEGQWFFNSDEGVISANFGPPESEGILSIVCNEPDRRISLHYGGELTPDQDTTLRILTATQSLDIPARSHNDGLPAVSADIAADAPQHAALLGALSTQQERFAIVGAGDTVVLPWDQSIARALANCR